GCDAVILCVLGRQLVGGGNVSEQVCGALPLPVGLGFCVGHVGHGSSLWDVVGGQSRWAIMRLTSASASAQSAIWWGARAAARLASMAATRRAARPRRSSSTLGA